MELLTVGNKRLQKWNGFKQHDLHTWFHGSQSTGSKVTGAHVLMCLTFIRMRTNQKQRSDFLVQFIQRNFPIMYRKEN